MARLITFLIFILFSNTLIANVDISFLSDKLTPIAADLYFNDIDTENKSYLKDVETTTFDVTFSVDMSNETVGANGVFLGGGFLGNAQAYQMTYAGNGIYSVTIQLEEGASGNYIFLNGPANGDDWGTKEDLVGQECADPEHYNDRYLDPITGDTTILFCFEECTAECIEPPALALQGILDISLSGNDGKAIHLKSSGPIADLSDYSIQVYSNGNTTPSQLYNLSGSALMDDDILIARNPTAMEDYMNASNFFEIIIDSSQESFPGINGDDVVELLYNGLPIEVFGEIGVDGTGESWEYLDSWAYKVDEEWTYGGVNCTDGSVTTWEATCVYPLANEEPSTRYNILFKVDMSNEVVGDTGVFIGGEFLGGAQAYAMTDNGEGIYSVMIELNEGTSGEYSFLNGPLDDYDWATKENLEGQPCAYGDYNDRYLEPLTGSSEIQFCFGKCVLYCAEDCENLTGAPQVSDDFDNSSVDILDWIGGGDLEFSIVDGTSIGANSNVLKYIDSGSEPFTNLKLITCNKFDMTISNKFTMDVFIESSSLTGASPNQLSLKLQDRSLGSEAWQDDIEIIVPIDELDTWQTLEFNFAGTEALNRDDFDQIVFQFNSENNFDSVTAYIDNFESSQYNPETQDISLNVPMNFETRIGLLGSDLVDETLSYSIIEQPQNGTVYINGENAFYLSNLDFEGDDFFTYVAENQFSTTSNVSTVSLNVFDAPSLTLTLDSSDIIEGGSAVVTANLDQESEYDVVIDLNQVLGYSNENDFNITQNDVVIQNNIITLSAGQTELIFEISAINDEVPELEENFQITPFVNGAVFQESGQLSFKILGNTPIITNVVNSWCPNEGNYSSVQELSVIGTYDFTGDFYEFGYDQNFEYSHDISSLGTVTNESVFIVLTNNIDTWNQSNDFPSINESNVFFAVIDWIDNNFSYRLRKSNSDLTVDQFGYGSGNGSGFPMLETYANRLNQTGPNYGNFNTSNWTIQSVYALENQGLCNNETSDPIEDIIGGFGQYTNENYPPLTFDIYEYTFLDTPISIELLAEDDFQENLTYELTSFTTNGQISIVDNIVTYTPNIGFMGNDQFTYIANDGEFLSSESVVYIGVVGTPEITFSIDTNEIAEHQRALLAPELSSPAAYDVIIDLNSISGTADENDFEYVSESHAGTRYIKVEFIYSEYNQASINEIKAILSDGTNVACGANGYSNSYGWGDWENHGSNAVDCDENTSWESNSDTLLDESNPHFIVVDLGSYYDLETIEITGDGRQVSFSLSLSSDNEQWNPLGLDWTDGVFNMNLSNFQITDIEDFGNNIFKIPSGETTVEIYVQGIEDDITEGTEVLTIGVPIVQNAELSNEQEFSLDILDVVRSFTLVEDMFAGFSDAEFAWGDYDLDGDMDLAIMGDQGNGVETLLYKNDIIDGEHIFIDTQQNFEALGFGTIKWVDLDKDGLLDLFISGIGQTGVNSILYMNSTASDGQIFTPSDSYDFPDLFQSDIDFGDLDNDGDVDFAFNGTDNTGAQVSYYGFQNASGEFNLVESNFGTFENGAIKIFDVNADGDNDVISSANKIMNTYFENNNENIYPSNNFEELDYFIEHGSNNLKYFTIGDNGNPSTVSNITTSFPSYVNGDFSIADYDNNGIEDIFITGSNTSSNNPGSNEVSSILFQGNQQGYSQSSEFDFQGFTNSSVEWVDYDNDGDLDLFLSGFAPGLGQKTYLYEYEITNKKNNPPAKVTELNFEDLGNGYVNLNWEAPVDDFSAIMGYNLRLGTTPGGDELSYLLSNQLTGDLLVNQVPTILNNSYTIQLDPGVYYWSVQAVDKGFKGGEFSDEQDFILTYDWKILNQGGVIDKSIQAVTNPFLEFMDIDNDGDYDLIYGQRDSSIDVYSYQDNLMLINDSYNFSSNINDLEIGDLNLDGSFDVIANNGTNENIVYLSNLGDSNLLTFDYNSFITENLYERIQNLADLNNDGDLDIINFGMDSENQFLANFKLFSSYYDSDSNNFITIDLSENFSSVSQLRFPSFDVGDFDNDNDLDIVLSGDLLFGENITKIFQNITEAGSQEIIFQEYSEADLPGVNDGSADFIDFDSDGDLDLLVSGYDSVGTKVFSMFENIESGAWPEIETNLPEMTDTQLDFGDFNSDGLSDLLISGTNENDQSVTQLMEYIEGFGFIESDYDLSEFSNAKFSFGDLDGDNDLDFVIAGQSSISNESIVRVYLNYRSESYQVNDAGARLSSFSENIFNERPSTPTISEISVVGENSEGMAIIRINWTSSVDDYTPQDAISYAIKIGTSSGAEDVLSSGALQNGYRKISGNGNAEYNMSWTIALTPGDYYTSVQSLDASFVGSEFSGESIFTLNPDNTLSINDHLNTWVGLHPNPSSSIVNISLKEGFQVEKLMIYDLLGRAFYLENDDGRYFDISNLKNGIYIVELILSNGNKITKKIIKK